MDIFSNILMQLQACYIYCALYFYYYYITSTWDHQTLDPRGWGPLLYWIYYKQDFSESLLKGHMKTSPAYGDMHHQQFGQVRKYNQD